MGVCVGLEDGGLQQPYAPCVFSGGKVHEAQDSDKQLFTVSAEWAMPSMVATLSASTPRAAESTVEMTG